MSDPTNDASELRSVLDDLHRHLVWQQDTGLTVLLSGGQQASSGNRQATAPLEARPAATPGARPAATPEARPAATPEARPGSSLKDAFRARFGATPPSAPPDPPPAMVAAAAAPDGDPPTHRALDEIRRELGDCQRCKLCKGRKNIVFGVGNPRAQLVFVGEGPGEQEDLQGLPFVGKAGELLTRMIEAMGFTRDEVYICNVVKCRPPGNRNPEPDEIEACEPFLKAQLASIQPRVIVALGKFAAQTLLRADTPISRLRGNWREYCGIQLMPTFHPAYLLRNPADKKLVWSDLQQVMKIFGKEPPRKGER